MFFSLAKHQSVVYFLTLGLQKNKITAHAIKSIHGSRLFFFSFSRLTANFLGVSRHTVNPIETLESNNEAVVITSKYVRILCSIFHHFLF